MNKCTSCNSTFSDAPVCPRCGMPQAMLDTDPIDPLVSVIDLTEGTDTTAEEVEEPLQTEEPPRPPVMEPWQPPAPPVRPRRRRRRRWFVVLVLIVAAWIGAAVANQKSRPTASQGVRGGAAVLASPTPKGTAATPTTKASTKAKPAYRTVHGQSKAFKAQIPASFHEIAVGKGGATHTFVSADGSARVALTMSSNSKAMSTTAALAVLVKEATARHEVVTYHLHSTSIAAASGTVDGPAKRVYYVREVVGPHWIYAMTWTYPYVKKSTYDALLVHAVASMTTGPT